jgi:hypothetical protein
MWIHRKKKCSEHPSGAVNMDEDVLANMDSSGSDGVGGRFQTHELCLLGLS